MSMTVPTTRQRTDESSRDVVFKLFGLLRAEHGHSDLRLRGPSVLHVFLVCVIMERRESGGGNATQRKRAFCKVLKSKESATGVLIK